MQTPRFNTYIRSIVLTGFFLFAETVLAQSPDGWTEFARVKFTSKFYKELNEYFLVPFFDTRIKSLEGKKITLQGHYMPLELEDNKVIVLSKYPYSQCFFCGGAGPESVAEIIFSSKTPRFKADQIVSVTGTLKLNDKDINHMNFILENATLIAKK